MPHEPRFDPAVDPILCSPYAEPDRHWELDAAGRAMSGVEPKDGRRASTLLRPVPDDHKTSQLSMDMQTVVGNEAVEAIRRRVGEWRSAGYPGTTSVTRTLLRHWADDDAHRQRRPFFAQREAVETLIWLREAARRDAPERRRVEESSRALNDGIVRYCAKMATGTGKTAVMGMLIAWQTLNAVRTRRRRNIQHSSRFLVLAPGLTVRDRLAVLAPSHRESVYEELDLVGELHLMSAARTLPESASYLLWYAKEKSLCKYNQPYEPLDRTGVIDAWSRSFSPPRLELSDGTARSLTIEEQAAPDTMLPPDAILFRQISLTSMGSSTTGRTRPITFRGEEYHCGAGRQWRARGAYAAMPRPGALWPLSSRLDWAN